MNNLNSLVIEGVVVGKPRYVEELEEHNVLNFTIRVVRHYKTRDGKDATELSLFKAVAYGCTANLKIGNQVRIVGRLRQNKWIDSGVTHSEEVQIVAEHIEIRKRKTKM